MVKIGGVDKLIEHEKRFERGYGALYQDHITQANEGCDFDFLARPGHNPQPDPH